MVQSPCINLCKMDAANGYCQGCFRTLEEITAWSRLDDPARARIVAAACERREAAAERKPA